MVPHLKIYWKYLWVILNITGWVGDVAWQRPGVMENGCRPKLVLPVTILSGYLVYMELNYWICLALVVGTPRWDTKGQASWHTLRVARTHLVFKIDLQAVSMCQNIVTHQVSQEIPWAPFVLAVGLYCYTAAGSKTTGTIAPKALHTPQWCGLMRQHCAIHLQPCKQLSATGGSRVKHRSKSHPPAPSFSSTLCSLYFS